MINCVCIVEATSSIPVVSPENESFYSDGFTDGALAFFPWFVN